MALPYFRHNSRPLRGAGVLGSLRAARYAHEARPLRGRASSCLLLVTSHEERGSRLGCTQALGRCAASLVTRCAAVAAHSLLRAACNEWCCCTTLAALRVTARRSRRCAACLLLSPLRGSVLVAGSWYRVAMKIQCCINVTRALRGIGAARLRSCSPHVRALPPRPYSRGILTTLSFVFPIVYPWG